jgi:HSP20 family protein
MPIFTYPLRPEASCQYAINPFVEAFLAPALAAAAAEKQQQSPKEKKPTNPSSRPQSVPKPAPTPRYHNRSLRSFEPHFDAYETAESYIVEGNLPGLADKKNLDIEFSDDRTLLIRGRIERLALPTSTSTPASLAIEEKTPEEETKEKRRSLNATVEDTDDEEDFAVVKRTDSSSSLASEGKKAEKKETVEEKKQEPATKTLLSERVFGSFQRTFAFPAAVDLDKVSASLEHGVLRVTVAKGFHGVKRIEVV